MPNKYVKQIFIIAVLFFIFGFITWINGALIPFMKSINELTDTQAYLVASASYISFVLMALPSSFVLSKIGYKRGMSLGLAIMAVGALIFIPAAESRTYSVFLLGIFVQGSGMTLLQTAANPYVTILGPLKSGAKRISIMGICNKVAGSLGSLIFGTILLSGIDKMKNKLINLPENQKEQLLQKAANSVVMPYIVMALILFILALLINLAPLPSLQSAEEKQQYKRGEKTNIFQFPHLWLGVLTLFLYVGAEVIAGDTIIAYGLSLGFPAEQARFFTTYTLLAMVSVYSLGIILIPKYISQEKALSISAVMGIVFSICILSTTGFTSVMFVAALGMSNALVWPAILALTLKGLGKFTKTGSALLVMAIAGGAIIPPLYGYLVETKKINLINDGVTEAMALAQASTESYWVLIPCYAMIFFYAIKGHSMKFK